jgi:threonine aldolase
MFSTKPASATSPTTLGADGSESSATIKVLPLPYQHAANDLAHERGLATHLDGARLFNAAIALGVAPQEIAAGFDSASVCLSKGLGAPVGSVLLGPRGLVDRAVRLRKMLGGGLRQAGVLAAAGIYALEHNVARLADDHANAQRLADGLRSIEALQVDGPHTNMVFVRVPPERLTALEAFLRGRGVVILARAASVRLVTHRDVGAAGVDRATAAFREFFARH